MMLNLYLILQVAICGCRLRGKIEHVQIEVIGHERKS